MGTTKLSRQARRGLVPQSCRKPAPKSRSLQRDFPAPRGHAPGERGAALLGSPSGRAGGAQRRLRGRLLTPAFLKSASMAESYIGGLPKGGVRPPLALNYIAIAPPAPARKHISPRYGRGRGVSERQWRSAANRSPLPLRSVLDAPHRGAGPEPAGETGVGTAKLAHAPGEAGAG